MCRSSLGFYNIIGLSNLPATLAGNSRLLSCHSNNELEAFFSTIPDLSPASPSQPSVVVQYQTHRPLCYEVSTISLQPVWSSWSFSRMLL